MGLESRMKKSSVPFSLKKNTRMVNDMYLLPAQSGGRNFLKK